jgi:hypothetical protein
MRFPEEVHAFFKKTGAQGGKKAAENMTAEERVARATKASHSRKKKGKKKK